MADARKKTTRFLHEQSKFLLHAKLKFRKFLFQSPLPFNRLTSPFDDLKDRRYIISHTTTAPN